MLAKPLWIRKFALLVDEPPALTSLSIPPELVDTYQNKPFQPVLYLASVGQYR
jgi:hypothetical protein